MAFTQSTNVSFKSNVQFVKAAIQGKLDTAFEAVRRQSVSWVHDKMLYGYHDPHGIDGHTEIYDTGALYRSIEAEIETKMFISHQVNVGSNMPYAVFVHNGTRKLKARPFIRDALEENADYFYYIIKDKLEELRNE